MNPATAAEANLVTHFTWVHRRTAGMRVAAERGLVLADSGLLTDTFNTVSAARLAGMDPRRRIQSALEWFGAVRRPFSWWVGPESEPAGLGRLLEAAGLAAAETELAMSAALPTLRLPDISLDGLDVRRARTSAELADFARVVSGTPPDFLVARFYELAAPALLAVESPLRCYVGYLNGAAVATSELAIGGGVVGIYNVATLEDYRRRGIGTALTVQPLIEARAEGYDRAILQAAAGGVGVYRRVGFEPFGQIVEYKPPAA